MDADFSHKKDSRFQIAGKIMSSDPRVKGKCSNFYMWRFRGMAFEFGVANGSSRMSFFFVKWKAYIAQECADVVKGNRTRKLPLRRLYGNMPVEPKANDVFLEPSICHKPV